MPRALAYGGAAVAGFAPPWPAVLGVAGVSVWAISLAILLCGHSSDKKPGKMKPGAPGAAATAMSNMTLFNATSGATTGGSVGASGGGACFAGPGPVCPGGGCGAAAAGGGVGVCSSGGSGGGSGSGGCGGGC
ncbi:hypothetical protein EJB05_43438, partial [Eragrostis curvula]